LPVGFLGSLGRLCQLVGDHGQWVELCGEQLIMLQLVRADQVGRLAVFLPGGWISCQWEDRGVPGVLGMVGV
jgi:hypothetical protein